MYVGTRWVLTLDLKRAKMKKMEPGACCSGWPSVVLRRPSDVDEKKNACGGGWVRQRDNQKRETKSMIAVNPASNRWRGRCSLANCAEVRPVLGVLDPASAVVMVLLARDLLPVAP